MHWFIFELKDLRKTKTKNRKLEASGSKMGGAGVPLKWVLLLVSLSPRELHHCQMAEAGLTAPAPGQAQVFHEVRAKAVATGEVHQAVAWPGKTTKRAWRKRGGKLFFFCVGSHSCTNSFEHMHRYVDPHAP